MTDAPSPSLSAPRRLHLKISNRQQAQGTNAHRQGGFVQLELGRVNGVDGADRFVADAEEHEHPRHFLGIMCEILASHGRLCLDDVALAHDPSERSLHRFGQCGIVPYGRRIVVAHDLGRAAVGLRRKLNQPAEGR